MAVTPYAIDGMSPERAAVLGVDFAPDYLTAPGSQFPAVALYSDRLAQWSNTIYRDDNGDITPDAWVDDPLYAADLADQNADDLASRLDTYLAANEAFLARATFPSAVIADQVKAVTKQLDALIRIERGLLNSTAGT
jgi:hypothetical protein